MKKLIAILGCVISGAYLAVPFIPLYRYDFLVNNGTETLIVYYSPMAQMVDVIRCFPYTIIYPILYFGLVGAAIAFFIIDRDNGKKKKWIFFGVATLIVMLIFAGLLHLPRG